ncbi:hypothetical protein BS47DRAFT_1325816 [Hydnum rufescens UP504]|uniref:Transcription initiation factor TFIID subunit 10 n=1 Tax=Hydnum rufescens UP504 TaxID=1448309 RepID=A0A9P6B6R1_9AGAM|nr:hypothetical protein BS47DRAFT_1325816 [Hydnum rufescens UP504]
MASQDDQSGRPQAGASTANTNGVPAPEATSATRRADELARKDRTLAEFMLMLDDYEPLIPNEVTDYYLQRVGFECDDVRLKRLLSLAAQKFVSDIAADAFQHARLRTNAVAPGRPRVDKSGAGTTSSARDKSKTVLTMDDLTSALTEYGISARKPDFSL